MVIGAACMKQMNQKKIKPKKCKSCGEEYQPFNSLQKACSPPCALDLVKQDKDKKFRKQTKEMKERIKSRSDWLKDVQTVFNQFIRLRDAKEPCISCQRHHEGQYHAGHYRSVGSAPELRFYEDNNHKQCAPCNNHLSGNLIPYRVNLIKKIGTDKVEAIEGYNEDKKYTISELKELKRLYKQKVKDLQNDTENN